MIDAYSRALSVARDAVYDMHCGKGSDRHVLDNEKFEDQVSMWIGRRGLDFHSGQAIKKVDEASRKDNDKAILELRGAINYIVMRIITLEDRIEGHEPTRIVVQDGHSPSKETEAVSKRIYRAVPDGDPR